MRCLRTTPLIYSDLLLDYWARVLQRYGGMPPELLGRVYRFSLASLRFYRTLPKTPDAQVPGVQFYKAATSSWANYRAAQRGRSRPEFISKLGIVTEESDEAVGWLEFMRDGAIASDSALLVEAKELSAMFTAALMNARRNFQGRGGNQRPADL